MLNSMADADLEDHECRSTQDNTSTITQAILDLETCMMSSKISQLLKGLLENKQLKCGPTKLYVGIALAHHSILSAQIDATTTGQAQEKAQENVLNNPECEVLIASIAASGVDLNIIFTNIVYLMVRGPPNFYPDFWTLTSTFPGAQLELSH
ncbi:hypothetical protein O181_029736 [Austropuccinia psidii MF-1]|uniref:Uncharacterized protein n=1 Tax=Austropuccinia psidii MF-1 TaxID=1389203 RepID=A0A9Q3CRK7_9BASI|nr:hypothetical protein [Austropuccinia psidii MF-1]